MEAIVADNFRKKGIMVDQLIDDKVFYNKLKLARLRKSGLTGFLLRRKSRAGALYERSSTSRDRSSGRGPGRGQGNGDGGAGKGEM
jgi:hypothetical protein